MMSWIREVILSAGISLKLMFRGVYTPAPELAEEFTLSGEWIESWTRNFKTSAALVHFNSQKGMEP